MIYDRETLCVLLRNAGWHNAATQIKRDGAEIIGLRAVLKVFAKPAHWRRTNLDIDGFDSIDWIPVIAYPDPAAFARKALEGTNGTPQV